MRIETMAHEPGSWGRCRHAGNSALVSEPSAVVLAHPFPDALPDCSSLSAGFVNRRECQLGAGHGPAIRSERAGIRAVFGADSAAPELADPDSFRGHRDRCVDVDDTRPREVLVDDA